MFDNHGEKVESLDSTENNCVFLICVKSTEIPTPKQRRSMLVPSKQDARNQFLLLNNQPHQNPLEEQEEYLHVYQ